MLDTKLRVKYMVEGDETERRRKKRQEAFAVQVKRGVNKMHVRLITCKIGFFPFKI